MREFILSAIVFSVVATAGVGAASENFSGIAFGDAYAFLGHHDDGSHCHLHAQSTAHLPG